jgi:hypothetical protein
MKDFCIIGSGMCCYFYAVDEPSSSNQRLAEEKSFKIGLITSLPATIGNNVP